jgi:hypothetical protein
MMRNIMSIRHLHGVPFGQILPIRRTGLQDQG